MTLGWLNSTRRYGCRCWTNIFFPKFLHVPLGVGGWPLGYEERRCWANFFTQLVSKIFDQCGHDPPMSQTDDMRSQDRALHYSASRGKKWPDIWQTRTGYPVHPLFLCWMSFLLQPSHFILAWDRCQVCWVAHTQWICYICYMFKWNNVILTFLLTTLMLHVHRESKKGDTILLSLSSLNIDRFS